MGQQKFLAFPDLKSWVFVVSNANMPWFAPRREAAEVHDMGSSKSLFILSCLGFIKPPVWWQLLV